MAPLLATDFGDPEDRADSRSVGRSALWAGFALVAMLGAILTARSEVGVRRINEALNLIEEPAEAMHAAVPQVAYDPVAETEARRLSERVRTLTADRERLLARLDALEQAVDVTGSIGRRSPAASHAPAQESAAPAAPEPHAPAVEPPAAAEPPAPPPGASVTIIPPSVLTSRSAQTEAAQTSPAEPVRTASAVAANEPPSGTATAPIAAFGIDLGSGPDAARLRALWSTVVGQNGQLLDGLRPAIVTHKRRGRHAELRLIAGPLRDPAAAARICAVLAGLGQACQPGTFEAD